MSTLKKRRREGLKVSSEKGSLNIYNLIHLMQSKAPEQPLNGPCGDIVFECKLCKFDYHYYHDLSQV